MSYNSTSIPTTSSSANNGNSIARTSDAQSVLHVPSLPTTAAVVTLPDNVDVAEYYKQQLRMATLQQQHQQHQEHLVAVTHHHENRDKTATAAAVVSGHHHTIQTTLDEYRMRTGMGNEGMKRYHDMKSSSASSPLSAEHVRASDEPVAKRLKQGFTSTPSLDQQYTDITWRPPVVTQPSTTASSSSSASSSSAISIIKTKLSGSSSRDTSKLPTEEVSGPSRSSGLVQQKIKTEDSPTLSNLTPEMKAMLMWQKIRAENLDCDYVKIFTKRIADELYQECEKTLTYYTGELAQIKIMGKKIDIPRKQVAHGDEGVCYTYSGRTLPAKPWTPVLNMIKERIEEVTQHEFNFVLINRYEDGNHYMGEHRDDEKELRRASPIASVSLGCTRDFIFRHADCRGREAKRQIPPIKLQLEHGSLLVMKYPTNEYWYHQLPVRKKAKTPRINLTFRDIVVKGTANK